jgi:hypothetical protein
MSYVTKYPGTVVDDSAVGSLAWTNPDNAKIPDAVYATASNANYGRLEYTHYLKATNFGFSIPLDQAIVGILVEIKRKANYNEAFWYAYSYLVKLVKGGTVQGDNKGNTDHWPTTNTFASHGGATDKWGLSLTPSDINSLNFGVVLQATLYSETNALTLVASVDGFKITVYYTLATYKDGSATLSALGSLSAQSVKVKLGSGIMLAQATLSAQPAKVKLGSGIMLAQASLSAFGEKKSKGFPVQHLAYRKDLLFTR